MPWRVRLNELLGLTLVAVELIDIGIGPGCSHSDPEKYLLEVIKRRNELLRQMNSLD